MNKNTPTPWKVFDRPGTLAIMTSGKPGKTEIIHWSGFDASHFPSQAKANAYFIVKAVNSHAALLDALKRIADTDQYPDHEDTAAELREIARGALALPSTQEKSP